jgi:hypothetical protein
MRPRSVRATLALAILLLPALAGAQNLALGRPATQSSDFAPAERANDGNTDGDYFDGSVSHTGFDNNAWWAVDLGASMSIGTIRVWNRTDCCYERLFPFQVEVQDVFDAALNTGTVFGPFPTPPGGPLSVNPIEIDAGGATGRFVKVQLTGANWLQLAEVQVLAAPSLVAPEPATLALLGGGLFALAGVARRRRA